MIGPIKRGAAGGPDGPLQGRQPTMPLRPVAAALRVAALALSAELWIGTPTPLPAGGLSAPDRSREPVTPIAESLTVIAVRAPRVEMIATVYALPGLPTAIGIPAGNGVVAVDPRVIPLGTHVWIDGYGEAVAGDTGGFIQGHRVDLGMESEKDALRFGVQPVAVFILAR